MCVSYLTDDGRILIMTSVAPVSFRSVAANYNAVKIKVDEPKTTVPEGFKSTENDNGIYNGVDIEVNRPMVDIKRASEYEYPKYDGIVTYDMIKPAEGEPKAIENINVSTNDKVSDNVTFNGLKDAPVEEKADDAKVAFRGEGAPVEEKADNAKLAFKGEDAPVEEKADDTKVAFKGEEMPAEELNPEVSFKGQKKNINVIPSVEIKPEIDIKDFVSKLSEGNYDEQAIKMAEIIQSATSSDKLDNFVTKDVFLGLMEIAQKDTSKLAKPTIQQEEIRNKIYINEMTKQVARENGEKPDNIKLPYSLSDNEIKLAKDFSEYELAERNKEYALITMAILAKQYSNDIEKAAGDIVPLTDLPGASVMVETLRNSDNASVKVAAIDSLMYVYRPDYKNEFSSLFKLVASDKNPVVAQYAALAYQAIQAPQN
ncbi:MAG: hypothetical protein Q4E83_06630 [bacterium]|nr:hypothetical protein [bacterium]